MRSSVWAKVVVGVFVLAVGFTLVSGQVGQAYAYTYSHHHYSGGYSYSWYYPYYSYYYSYPYCYGYGYYGCYNSYSYYSQPSQYQLTVASDPSSLSSQVAGGGSYSQGSSATFSANQNMIQVSKDTRYVFSRWSGDYAGSGLSGSITMNAAKAVTAVYQLQYYLTVTVQPSNAPLPQGSGWYNASDTVTLTGPSQTVGGSDGARLVFNGWSLDGNSQSTSALNVQMNAPHMVAAQYKQQYYLTVLTDRGVASGQGWYDAGSYAPISVSTPPNPSYGVNVIFNGWQGDLQSASQSANVLMDGRKSVTATWRTDPTVLYATIAALLIAIALGLLLVTKRRKETVTAPNPTMQTNPTVTNPEKTQHEAAHTIEHNSPHHVAKHRKRTGIVEQSGSASTETVANPERIEDSP